MPIRINLLSEQQAEEEARRRDPVKRALWLGGAIVVVTLLWIGYLQFQIGTLKSDLNAQETHWRQIEPQFLQVSNNFREAGAIRKKLESLQAFATNRFLWANPLHALQYAADEKVRLISFVGTCTMTEQKPSIFSTNLFFSTPKRSWWQWRAEPLKTNVVAAAQAVAGVVTNKPEFLRYQAALLTSPFFAVTTNPVQIVAKIDVIKPDTVTENISLTIGARDYSNPPRKFYEKCYQAITNAPYFRQFMGKTNGMVQPVSIQLRDDRTDLINPSELFIPFTVDLFFPERIRSNE